MSNTKFRRHFLDEKSTKGKEKPNRIARFKDEGEDFDWREAVHKAKGEQMEELIGEGITIENSGDKA